MNKFGVSWLILLAANALLWLLLTWVNQFFAIWSIALYLPATLCLFAALHANHRIAFSIALVSGLFIDALSPLPFLSQTFVLFLCTATLMGLRRRIRTDSIPQATAIGATTNALAFIVYTLLIFVFSPLEFDLNTFFRIVADLVLSQLAFLAVSPWFLEFQTSLLHLIGASPIEEPPTE